MVIKFITDVWKHNLAELDVFQCEAGAGDTASLLPVSMILAQTLQRSAAKRDICTQTLLGL